MDAQTIAQHPRYADRYTGELFFLQGVEGEWTELMDMVGRRTRVLTASFERAYDAVDVVTRPGDECLELWLGDAFQGELRRTSGGYALRIAGERFENPCRGIYDVLTDLGLDPSGTRILGL